ncbi:l-lysine -aminomutase [Apiospora arundinis]|uniref:L-lysine 2-3-aminomutase n=1 Tax=Apiospora arundinis TaxID=335852 RepID=A0ABR2J5N0_9PEZI
MMRRADRIQKSLSGTLAVRQLASRAIMPPHSFMVPRAHYSQAAAVAVPEPENPFPCSNGVDEFWRKVPMWEDVSTDEFISWSWTKRNLVEHHSRSAPEKLQGTLTSVLPDHVPLNRSGSVLQSRDEFISDIFDGIAKSSMSLRITPHAFSRINWQDPRHDPVFRQFIPLGSLMLPNHPKNEIDSLHEKQDQPVEALVHRYPDKALFLPIAVCPTYCAFCTRSWAVGPHTSQVTKEQMLPILKRWEAAFKYIEATPQITDIVVSGGDAYYLTPEQLAFIGERLLKIPNVKKFRIASKGLGVAPNRILDPNDQWSDALLWVHRQALKAGKRVALHTHINHPNEISWVTKEASRKLIEGGLTIRNQSVLLRGINDDVETVSKLIRSLAEDLRIQPYYVYQCDMVENVEHLRTPLQTIIDIEAQLRGSIAGFDMPQFIVDLPKGGGKRLAGSFLSYDRSTGVSRYTAPAVTGGGTKVNKVYEYYDPLSPTSKTDPAN